MVWFRNQTINCDIQRLLIPAMQSRLSTIFLVFFAVAASLALFCQSEFYGFWLIALWLDAVIFFAAICVNRSESLKSGVIQVAAILFIGLLCTGLLLPLYSHAEPKFLCAACKNNLKQLGLALYTYHEMNQHFPSVNTCNKDGKPLFSWRVEILPMMEYGSLYESLKKDEPWDGPNNAKVSGQFIPEFLCPGDNSTTKRFASNYIAVIGPGTTWREDGPIKLSDLPDGGSHTVMAVEVVDSDINWAEPRDITVDELLENMRVGKGVRIPNDHHINQINVLFADGIVQSLPTGIPVKIWAKIFAGEMKNFEDLVHIPILTSKEWTIILAIIIWLFSVVLLFHRAVKSRRKPVISP